MKRGVASRATSKPLRSAACLDDMAQALADHHRFVMEAYVYAARRRNLLRHRPLLEIVAAQAGSPEKAEGRAGRLKDASGMR